MTYPGSSGSIQQQRPSLQAVSQSIRNNINFAHLHHIRNNLNDDAQAVLSECQTQIQKTWHKLANQEDYMDSIVSKGYFLMDDNGAPMDPGQILEEESRTPLQNMSTRAQSIAKEMRDNATTFVTTGALPASAFQLDGANSPRKSQHHHHHTQYSQYVVPSLDS
jgi:hypothetical protein